MNPIESEEASFLREDNEPQSNPTKNFLDAFRKIEDITDKLELSNTIAERTKVLFKQVSDKIPQSDFVTRTYKRYKQEATILACLYIACRQVYTPYTFKEIGKSSGVPRREIGHHYNIIQSLPGIKPGLNEIGVYLPKFCSTLGLLSTTCKAAKHIAKRTIELNVAPNKSPVTLAAASIYLATRIYGQRKPQMDLAKISGISRKAIGRCCKLMKPRITELLPPDEPSSAMAEKAE